MNFPALVTLFLVAAAPPKPKVSHTPKIPPVVHCGTERWDVKTLQDVTHADLNASERDSTLHALLALPPPKKWETSLARTAQENSIHQIEGWVTGYKLETDRDFHVVLENGKESMVIEFVDPSCIHGITPYFHSMVKAREDFLRIFKEKPSPKFLTLKTKVHVKVRGVAFFDRLHGQKGVAPNGIELHPVLSIQAFK